MLNPHALQLGSSPSCIRELFHYGRELVRLHGEDAVCDFSLGNPATPPPEEVLDAFSTLSEHPDPIEIHGYTVAGGDPAVRRAIAEELSARYGVALGGEHLFLTAGACPALVATFGALTLDKTTEFVAIAPYFPEYKTLVEGAGATLVVAEADTARFQINFDSLAGAIGPHTQGVIINSPNNPSGAVYTRETLTTLARLLTQKSKEVGHPIYLISDEPYRELVYGACEVPYVPSLYPYTVVCYSYSKSLSLPGDRIGYVLVPPTVPEGEKLLLAIAGAARMSGHVCAPALLQRVVGLTTSARPDLSTYDRNRATLYNALTEMGYTCVHPDGAFYLLVKSPFEDGDAFSYRAKEKGLLLVPGRDFGVPAYVRVAYCVKEEVVTRSLPLFEALMAESKL